MSGRTALLLGLGLLVVMITPLLAGVWWRRRLRARLDRSSWMLDAVDAHFAANPPPLQVTSSTRPAGVQHGSRIHEVDTDKHWIFVAAMHRWVTYVEGVDYTCVMGSNCGCLGAGLTALEADTTIVENCPMHAAMGDDLWTLPALHHREADFWSRVDSFRLDGTAASLDADGFTHTVLLGCGCHFRLNYADSEVLVRPGHWYTCFKHSAPVGGYDPDTGDPNLARDQQVVVVNEEDRHCSACAR